MHVGIGVGPDIIYVAFPFISFQIWSESRICLWCGRNPETQHGRSSPTPPPRPRPPHPRFLDVVTQVSEF